MTSHEPRGSAALGCSTPHGSSGAHGPPTSGPLSLPCLSCPLCELEKQSTPNRMLVQKERANQGEALRTTPSTHECLRIAIRIATTSGNKR